jgi:glycosyltransferase involved in cell wall biosynthesis
VTNRKLISVCIVCRNEADRLGPCLNSVSGWADEVIVMDLSSSDGSADVARRYGARVVTRPPIPVVEPLRNEVADLAQGDWILALDPDERVTPGLAEELRRLTSRSEIDLIVIPFTHRDFGYAASSPLLRYDPKPRMYRRGRVSWPTVPNALPRVSAERTYSIPPHDEFVMIHERNRNVEEALDRIARYAPAQARSMLDAGESFTARAMFSTLAEKVLRQFYASQAARDGVPGMIRAANLVAYHFYVWAALWQLSGGGRTADDDAFFRRLGIGLNLAARGALATFAAAERIRQVEQKLRALTPHTRRRGR